MPLVLDATPKGANSNSFTTIEYSDAYHEGRLYSTGWTAAAQGKKAAALVQATELLGNSFDWFGEPTTLDQALPFPRYSVFDKDGRLLSMDVVPKQIQNATAELANLLLQKDREAETGTEGIKSLTVGSVSLDFDKNDRPVAIPDSIVRMVSSLGTVLAVSSKPGIVAVPLWRT